LGIGGSTRVAVNIAGYRGNIGGGMSQTTPSTANPAPTNGHGRSAGELVHRFLLPRPLPLPINPALLKHAEKRAEDEQNRVADRITTFAGSMAFVYIHILWFGCWIGFGVEKYPFGLLTMIVSLEAIFLSTFVMISQNRADAKRQVIADQEWRTVQLEDQQNTELLTISKQILKLTKEVRSDADTVQSESDQNKELLDLSRQTLALTKELQARFVGTSVANEDASSQR
jgi:uncharacterized membrane protein